MNKGGKTLSSRTSARKGAARRAPWIFATLLIVAHPGQARADGIDDDSASIRPYTIEIDKSERTLAVKSAGRVVRTFSAASGRGGSGGKMRLGDNKTPEGIYRITGFHESDRFYMFMNLNYPNIRDAFSGLDNDIISAAEFDAIVNALRYGRLPPQGTGLGGAIGIHGIGEENRNKLEFHRKMNWTEGCIALTNEEMNELRNYVAVGTEVVIRQ